jgi:serine/threonine-protein kinase
VLAPNVPPPIDVPPVVKPVVAEPASALTVKAPVVPADLPTPPTAPPRPDDALPKIVPATDLTIVEAPEEEAAPAEETVFQDPGLPADPSGGIERPAPDGGPPTKRVTAIVETVEGDDDAPDLDRRSVFVYVLVALGIVAGAIIAFVGYHALSTPSYAVPNVVGLSEDEATNQVAANGWNIQKDHRRDDTQAQGNVISTQPAAGEKLKKGATFMMVVSDGPTLATLPEITGMPLDQARATLEAVQLVVREADTQFSEDMPAGNVLFWEVPAQQGLSAGGQVPKGTTVEVTVSAGPTPRLVPNLVGLSVDQARQKLTDVGLALGDISQEINNDVPAGQIVSSSPAAGASAARGATVSVLVSNGPDIVSVPDLRGLTKKEVDVALTQNGLVLGTVSGPLDGVVGGQEPAPGTKLTRGSKVNVVFGT